VDPARRFTNGWILSVWYFIARARRGGCNTGSGFMGDGTAVFWCFL